MPPRNEEAAAFFAAAYAAIQEIPHGKVTSYAHIARLIGRRELKPEFSTCITPHTQRKPPQPSVRDRLESVSSIFQMTQLSGSTITLFRGKG